MRTKSILLVTGMLASVIALADGPRAKEVHVPQGEVNWTQPWGPQGPSFGFVQGSLGKLGAPASFFVKFPAGGDSGWHIHDNDYEAVVLKGTFTEQQKGEAAETLLPSGTYFTEPAKEVHRNGCTKEAECLLYVHFSKGATNHPTSPDGKLLPPPKPESHAGK